uniref:NADH-ubiquinone oxidoreductase chain 5 n=1 Tax=Onychiurus orientalis TaxID=280588 RepID=Q6DVH3_ONYOR|nr:NADH dehydrogenase subunit 5 [Onychiurus orientalis]AAT69326.1 NADH dehydrogenase subunit 5 [Onychiurus orientalis]
MMKIYIKISLVLGSMLGFLSLISLCTSLIFFCLKKSLFIEWSIFFINSVEVTALFLLDWMSLSFAGLVMFISSIVMHYLTGYMKGDINYVRFTWLVYLFVLSMILLITSPNMISILLGWDGLGLVSYCSVIYYQNVKSANAGMLTILMNRVGDVAILLAISWMFNYGGWNIFYLPYLFSQKELFVILLLVTLAAMTKSAQVPFSAWLPAAMAAPTPVSSLVHSSTLVTAGVYLLIRFSELVGISLVLLVISVLTMMISGLNAIFETDMKKVIALSTLSQLGVMFMTISLGLIEMAFFHMLSHALFKSLLFLCAGVVIRGSGDIQDVRDLGGVSSSSPVTSLYFLVSSLSLCGFPYLSGFYSKDILLEMYLMGGQINTLALLVVMTSILLTGVYSTKLALILFVKPLGLKTTNSVNEEEIMCYPMSLLFLVSIFGGSMMFWWFTPTLMVYFTLLIKMMLLFLVVTLTFLTMNILSSTTCKGWGVLEEKLVLFVTGMFYLPVYSSETWMPLLRFGKITLKNLDHGWVEYMGGQGLMNFYKNKSLNVDIWNFLNLKLYLFMFFILFVFILLV